MPGPSAEDTGAPLTSSGADPLASLRLFPVEVTLGGYVFEVPALPAIDWLEVLLAEPLDAERIFPGLAGEDVVDQVDRLLVDEVITFDELMDTALDVITAGSGRPWWFTVRLCATSRAAWDRIGGPVSGVDITVRPLGAWLDCAYWAILESIDPRKAGEVSGQLMMPPAGWLPEFDEDAESAAFMAMMAQAQNMG